MIVLDPGRHDEIREEIRHRVLIPGHFQLHVAVLGMVPVQIRGDAHRAVVREAPRRGRTTDIATVHLHHRTLRLGANVQLAFDARRDQHEQ